MTRVAVALGLVALAVLAAAAPLLTYSLSLATFGLAHVAVELRYVEARFRTRLSTHLVAGLALLVGGVMVLRALRLADARAPTLRLQAELALVALVSGSITWDLGLRAGLASATAVGVAAAIGLGAALAPIPTLLVLAVLHNWTPVGFVAEAAPAHERPRWLGWGLLAFVVLPALVAAGPLQAVTDAWGLRDWTLLPTSSLAKHLGAFLPRAWHTEPWAPRLFSAVAFAQCMHYAAVLGVLPGLAPTERVGPLTSIPWSTYAALVVAGSLLLGAGWLTDFGTTRSVYSIFASVHAWVELPVLILALAPRR